MSFANDTFTEASNTALASHTPSSGGSWAEKFGTNGATVIGGGDYVEGDSSAASSLFYHSASPASNEYDIEATCRVYNTGSDGQAGVAGRIDTGTAFYTAMLARMYIPFGGAAYLEEVYLGSIPTSSSWANSWTMGTAYVIKLEMRTGTNGIKLYVDGTQRVQITPASLTAAGKSGLLTRTNGRVASWSATDYSSSPSVNLTGIAATVSRGTLSPATAVPLTGQSSTVSFGTLTPSQAISVALAGIASTLSSGTLSPALAITLTGMAATVNRGTMVPTQDTLVALAGLSSSFSIGTLGPALSVSVSGLSVSINSGTLVPASGNTVVLAGQSMTASSGSITANLAISLLGQSVTTSRGTITPVTSGNVSVNLNGLATIVYKGDVGVSPSLAPETVEFSWANNKVVFTFQKYTTSFEFD